MVIIVIADRCCFENDLEVIRICHAWDTKFKIVRTKFDVDLCAFVYDRPEKIKELAEDQKCNGREIAKCLREEMSEELTDNLKKHFIKHLPKNPGNF